MLVRRTAKGSRLTEEGSETNIADQLRSHPLFATFTPEQLAEVARVGSAVTYQPGDVLIQQGEPGDVFGVLISGRLEAVRGFGPPGGEVFDTPEREHLGYLEAGECFGEMSLLTGNPTSADVVALTEAEAVIFLQEAISPLIALDREAVQFLTRLITARLAPPEMKPKARRPGAMRYSLGASAPMRILSVSCRRGDVRYSYFDTTSEEARARGSVTGLASGSAVHVYQGPKGTRESRLATATHEAALEAVLAALTCEEDGVITSPADLSAIGHRVVHGGCRFDGPALVDDEVKEEIRRLADLAPLDNIYNLTGIEVCQGLAPEVPQVAVFDTAFHLRMPVAAYRYALPKDLAQEPELRRFGFHGISHEGAARLACAFLETGFNTLEMVTCHLGRGASLCAIDHGRSVDTTMGLTPLGGLVMATRSGDLDPGLLLHLVRGRGISPQELSQRLNSEAGILGLSGLSDDVLTVAGAADNGDPQALLALEVFCRQAKKYLSAYIGLLGGVDVIVFTGGVGENSPGVRARICQGLEWMGIILDEERNRSADVAPGEVARISQPQSRAHVLVVGGDEEGTIARQSVRALSQQPVTEVMRQKPRPIPIGISAHHVHLSQEHVEVLFGPGHTLTWYADLTQPGQFACAEKVNLLGPKGRIDRVRVLGPVRPETQVEIARTEEYKLGIDAPIRMSGDLEGSPGITLEGPAGTLALEQGVICAMRHIHMEPEDAFSYAVRDHDTVRVCISGPRSVTFGDVCVRVSPDYRLEMHLDTDEANAAELSREAVGTLDSIQERAPG